MDESTHTYRYIDKGENILSSMRSSLIELEDKIKDLILAKITLDIIVMVEIYCYISLENYLVLKNQN